MSSPTIDTTKTCGTCRFKGENIEVQSEEADFDFVPSTYFLCTLIKHINDEYPHYKPGLGAGVKDGSGYYAALCVEDDFGCNKWEPMVAVIDGAKHG